MTDEQLNEWAALQSQDKGELAREIIELRRALLWVKPRIVERYLTKGEAREMLGKIIAALKDEPC